MTERFSSRYGYGSAPERTIYEDAPAQIRVGLREILSQLGHRTPTAQRQLICRALRVMPDSNNWSDYPNVDGEVDWLLSSVPWYKFYDMCERLPNSMWDSATDSGECEAVVFERELNRLFQEENVGYRMQSYLIQKLGTEDFHRAVAAAEGAMADPRFAIPLQLFSKSLEFRNARPPDYANAVKEAVNAVEASLQIVVGRPGVSLTALLSELDPPLPDGLKKIYQGLYGYGSGSEGARHASVGGHIAQGEEAEFIIHTAAAAIQYAAAKYGTRGQPRDMSDS